MKTLPRTWNPKSTAEKKLIGLLAEQISKDGPIPAFRLSKSLTTGGMDLVVRQYMVKLNRKGQPVASCEKNQTFMSRREALRQGRVEIRAIGVLNVHGAVPLIKDRDAARMILMTCILDPDDVVAKGLLKRFF